MTVSDYLARLDRDDVRASLARECPVCHAPKDRACNGATRLNEVHLWRRLHASRRFRDRVKRLPDGMPAALRADARCAGAV